MPVARRWITTVTDDFEDISVWLWWLAITFFGVADVITTSAATLYAPIGEGSPLVGHLLGGHGVVGLVTLKLVAFVVAYLTWRVVGEPNNVGVPLALAVIGIGLTTWNLFVLAATYPI